jgi:hypothetical protein
MAVPAFAFAQGGLKRNQRRNTPHRYASRRRNAGSAPAAGPGARPIAGRPQRMTNGGCKHRRPRGSRVRNARAFARAQVRCAGWQSDLACDIALRARCHPVAATGALWRSKCARLMGAGSKALARPRTRTVLVTNLRVRPCPAFAAGGAPTTPDGLQWKAPPPTISGPTFGPENRRDPADATSFCPPDAALQRGLARANASVP